MLSPFQIKGLCTFAHSRLSGKYTNTLDTKQSILYDEENISKFQNSLNTIIKELETDGSTIATLNLAKNSSMSSLVHSYYIVALNELEKEIPTGEIIIEGVMGIIILSYLHDEIGVKKFSISPMEIISMFETENKDKQDTRKLMTKMLKIGTQIIEKVQNTKVSQLRINNKSKSKKNKRKRK